MNTRKRCPGCCGGNTCCRCMLGSSADDGGCCWTIGDRIKLTIPRGSLGTIYTGGANTNAQLDCDGDTILNPRYCCGYVECEAEEPFEITYEVVEELSCVNIEITDGELNPAPDPIIFDPPDAGGFDPPEEGGGTPPEDGETDYCHRAIVFAIAELNDAALDFLLGGGDSSCVWPIEWVYVCAGCETFDAQIGCVVPDDHRPDSDEPCGYLTPEGVTYLPAYPARGWAFTCDPEAPCAFCIAACASGPCGDCQSLYSGGEVIGEPPKNLCGVDACDEESLCPSPDVILCESTITVDLTGCDGGQVCCHKRMTRRESCDPNSGWECLELGVQTATFERVGFRGCVWDDEEVRCRTRRRDDALEPVDAPDCPPEEEP